MTVPNALNLLTPTEDQESMREESLNLKLKYPWQRAVFDALTELDADCVSDKVTLAEKALSKRLGEKPSDLLERLALRDALVALRIVFPAIKWKADSQQE